MKSIAASLALVGIIVLIATACSPIHFTNLSGKSLEERESAVGYIIYPPKYVFFLRFEGDQDGRNCLLSKDQVFKALLMPDKSKPIAVNFRSILGSSKTGLSLVDGWLVNGVNVETDTTGVITKMAELYAGTLSVPASENQALEPGVTQSVANCTSHDGLYGMEFDDLNSRYVLKKIPIEYTT